MSTSLDTLIAISNTKLINTDLRYCLVTTTKVPFTYSNFPARSNVLTDFVSIDKLLESEYLNDFAGIGISIQASDICAIDVDDCFSSEFDISSADERAKDILEMFKDKTYCEFSFSGRGLRILLKADIISDYSNNFYIKNKTNHIEYYQPTKSNRYVTVTGKYIYNNDISFISSDLLLRFLNTFLKRAVKKESKKIEVKEESRPFAELQKQVKLLCYKDGIFQDLWFSTAPGSGKDESERDYQIIAILFEKVTQDKESIKQLFESSPFFKSKDFKHITKWNNQNFRYFEYIYGQIKRRKI